MTNVHAIDTYNTDDGCKLLLNAEIENKMFAFVNAEREQQLTWGRPSLCVG